MIGNMDRSEQELKQLIADHGMAVDCAGVAMRKLPLPDERHMTQALDAIFGVLSKISLQLELMQLSYERTKRD
jgi:hypothetical protein